MTLRERFDGEQLLLDTGALAKWLNANDRTFARELDEARAARPPMTCTIRPVVCETLRGLRNRFDIPRLADRITRHTPIVEVTPANWLAASDIYIATRATGYAAPLSITDTLLVAVSARTGATVVTFDEQDFAAMRQTAPRCGYVVPVPS